MSQSHCTLRFPLQTTSDTRVLTDQLAPVAEGKTQAAAPRDMLWIPGSPFRMGADTDPALAFEARAVADAEYQWELYNLKEDYSQFNDLAAKMPEKLKQMQTLFVEEARSTTCIRWTTRRSRGPSRRRGISRRRRRINSPWTFCATTRRLVSTSSTRSQHPSPTKCSNAHVPLSKAAQGDRLISQSHCTLSFPLQTPAIISCRQRRVILNLWVNQCDAGLHWQRSTSHLRPSGPWGVHPPPIEPLEQRRQLSRRQPHHPVADGRPYCRIQHPDHLAEKHRVDARPDAHDRAADLDLDRRGIGPDAVFRNDRNKNRPQHRRRPPQIAPQHDAPRRIHPHASFAIRLILVMDGPQFGLLTAEHGTRCRGAVHPNGCNPPPSHAYRADVS
jgi:hypothetical protein